MTEGLEGLTGTKYAPSITTGSAPVARRWGVSRGVRRHPSCMQQALHLGECGSTVPNMLNCLQIPRCFLLTDPIRSNSTQYIGQHLDVYPMIKYNHDLLCCQAMLPLFF